MGIISRLYIKKFVKRYDKEVGVPYYSHLDFKGLQQEKDAFIDSRGVEVHYFYYYYNNYKEDKVILFCPGIGPGHTAYLAEINQLAKRGYKVLTLDYSGCGESKGDNLGSLNTPTSDVIDLLNHLNLNKPIILIGHSLGGFTALNVINIRKDINKAVILSGFLSIPSLVKTIIKSNFVSSRIFSYEKKAMPQYYNVDNIEFLNHTDDTLLFIQSEDDTMIPYDISLKVVEEIDNPSIKTIKLKNRNHNPNYTESAVNYMNEVFGEYNKLIKDKKIKTDEDKMKFFKDVSLSKLTEQDEDMFGMITNFVEG